MLEFTVKDRQKLITLLLARNLMPEKKADEFTDSLLDIRTSAAEIYDEHIPKLMKQLESNADADEIKDTLWDIQEAGSHIHFHVKSVKLPHNVDPWTPILEEKKEEG